MTLSRTTIISYRFEGTVMEYDISSRPSYAQLELALEGGESVRAEAGVMMSHTGGLDVETNAEGGLLKSLSWKLRLHRV